MEYCLDNINPSLEQVRKWAYAENVYFTNQDEDLILHAARYAGTLLELASDSRCPKHDYCFSILNHYAQTLLARREWVTVDNIIQNLPPNPIIKEPNLLAWKWDLIWINNLITNPSELTFKQCDYIAWFLMGDYLPVKDPINKQLLACGIWLYTTTSDSNSRHLYINPDTGNWRLSRSGKLSSGEIGVT